MSKQTINGNLLALLELDRLRQEYAPRIQQPTVNGQKLELTIELDFGHEAIYWGNVPSTLLSDEQDRLYLERWDQSYGEQFDTFTVNDGTKKRVDEIVEGDLIPVSPKAALEWYARANEFSHGSTGDLVNLCRIAAKALRED